MRFTLDPIPPILYHGTDTEFSQFDLAFKGSSTGWNNTIHGFFFTEKQEHAAMFGQRIIPVHLQLNKMLDLTINGIFTYLPQAHVVWEAISGQRLKRRKALKKLGSEIGLGEVGEIYEWLYTEESHELFRAHGYDGIISSLGDGHLEYIAFDVKSITML